MQTLPGRSTTSISPVPLQPAFAITFRPGPAWLAGKPLAEQPLENHVAYWKRLFGAGRVLFAGPFLDNSGGAAFFRAANMNAAAAVLSDDPAVASGVFIGEISPWMTVFHAAPLSSKLPEKHQESECNAKIVRDLFVAVEKRDSAAVVNAYDPAIRIHEAPSLPYGGDYHGHQGAFEHATGYRAAWDAFQGDNERSLDAEVVANGDRVMVFWTQKARLATTNETYAMPVVSVYRMQDGRVIDSRMFHFDAAASRDFLNRALLSSPS